MLQQQQQQQQKYLEKEQRSSMTLLPHLREKDELFKRF